MQIFWGVIQVSVVTNKIYQLNVCLVAMKTVLQRNLETFKRNMYQKDVRL